jgi:hypothetical protein
LVSRDGQPLPRGDSSWADSIAKVADEQLRDNNGQQSNWTDRSVMLDHLIGVFGPGRQARLAMARSPMAERAAFTDGSWTPRRQCSAPSEGVATSMSANGATQTFGNARYPIAMGW